MIQFLLQKTNPWGYYLVFTKSIIVKVISILPRITASLSGLGASHLISNYVLLLVLALILILFFIILLLLKNHEERKSWLITSLFLVAFTMVAFLPFVFFTRGCDSFLSRYLYLPSVPACIFLIFNLEKVIALIIKSQKKASITLAVICIVLMIPAYLQVNKNIVQFNLAGRVFVSKKMVKDYLNDLSKGDNSSFPKLKSRKEPISLHKEPPKARYIKD